MGAFTNITAATEWQRVGILNEMRKGVAERQEACGKSSPFMSLAVANVTNIQVKSFWRSMQEALEDMYSSFVNHTVTIDGEAAVTMFSRAGWIEVADLGGPVTTAGDCFRRATTRPTDWTDFGDPAFSYGYMEADGSADDDIIGPWIMDDIQRGLKALQWTLKSTSTGEDYYLRGNWTSPYYNGSDSTCDSARTGAQTNYALGWTSSTPYGNHYFASRTRYYDFGSASPVWRWSERRAKGKPQFVGITVPAGITYDYDAYLFVDGTSGNPDPDGPASGWTNGVLNKYADNSAVSETTLTTGYPGAGETDLLGSWTCPLADNTDDSESRFSTDAKLILKWNFTNE